MKRHIFKFTSSILLLLISLVLVSCSDSDDEDFSTPVFNDLNPISIDDFNGASINTGTAEFIYSAPSDATFLRLFIFDDDIQTSGHNFSNTGDLVAGNDTDKDMESGSVSLNEMLGFDGSDFTIDTFTFTSGYKYYYWTIVGYDSDGYPVASSPKDYFEAQ